MALRDSREMNYGSEFRNKSSSVNQGKDDEVADGLGDKSSRFPKDGFHNYVNKEITFVRSTDIRKYARGKHTQLSIGLKVHPKYGLR